MATNNRIWKTLILLNSTLLVSPVLAATITGKVVDTSNHPLAAAIVTLSEEAVTKGVAPTMHGAATKTAADGTFSFANLDAATYLLCAQVPRGTLLNPCQWTKTLPQVTVASSTATASITLTMHQGYRIPIRLDDPQNLLATHDGKTPGAHLLIGVSGGYHFEEAVIDATDNAGRNVSLLVPFDTPVPITVQSNFFKLQDGAGNSLNRTNSVPITASSAFPMSGFTVKVVGKN
jgi:hypothetical protein